MRDFGARLCAGAGRAAGVGKEVQHLRTSAGARCVRFDLFAHPVPVDRLLGKQPRVFEAGRTHDEREIAVRDRPLLGQLLFILPVPAAGRAAVIHRVGARFGAVHRPDRLRVGTQQRHIAPALQLVAVACV